MDRRQTFAPFTAIGSSLASILPPLLIGGLAIAALVWLFSNEKKPETPLSGAENGNTGTKPPIPPPVSASTASPASTAPSAPPVPPSVHGGGRKPNEKEEEILKIWEKEHLNELNWTAGNLFLR